MSTIRSRLLASFTVILLLLISSTFIVLYQLSETNDRLTNLVDISTQRINLSNEIMISILQVTRNEKNSILESDASTLNEYKSEIAKSVAIIEKKLHNIKKIASDKIIIDELKTAWKEYIKVLDEIIDLSEKNRKKEAYKISNEDARTSRTTIVRLTDSIIKASKEKMESDKKISNEIYASSVNLIMLMIIVNILLVISISYWIIKGINKRISFLAKGAEKIASREFITEKFQDDTKDELRPISDSLVSIIESFKEITSNAQMVAAGDFSKDIVPISEKDILGNSLKVMTNSLREITAENEKHNWLVAGQNQLNNVLRGDVSMEELADKIVTFLIPYLNATIGTLYLLNDNRSKFILVGKYAFSPGMNAKEEFGWSEGLIGQAAQEGKRILLENVKDDYLRITSSVIDTKPQCILIVPFLFEGKTLGVIEIGKLTGFSDAEMELTDTIADNIGISMNSSIARKKIQELLEETQLQSEELQSQQEKLTQSNVELEEQTQELKQQQEEIQSNNEELEEQTQILTAKNQELEEARIDIEQKTKQLEVSSKYKSEFLANMSHELRTPLNSLLILSKDLSENQKGNLTADQEESAEIIYKSGKDLLVLINEVLDLSKIEAGKMTLNVEKLSLSNFATTLKQNFRHHTNQKGLSLKVDVLENIPAYITTDEQRLDQIMKNLISNAIKFTDTGGITITLGRHSEDKVFITVADTGVGIPEEKQNIIFEAFHQADGGTSRKYGGTGLGLSISRELAKLLGAEIRLTSAVNQGSAFTLILPLKIIGGETAKTNARSMPEQWGAFDKENEFVDYPSIDDDRDKIGENDHVVLMIEDDLKFAAILQKQAHERNLKCLLAASGEDGLLMAKKHNPHAIILDRTLPGMTGDHVLSELKANPALRHIPVHILSVRERSLDLIKEGAVEYLMKPIDKQQLDGAFNRIENFINRKMKNLLIIEDDENARTAVKKLIGNGDVNCLEAATGKDALQIIKENQIDCIILDLGLPDMSGFDIIRALEKIPDYHLPPIIVNTGREISKEENDELQEFAQSIIIKGVKSEDRLLDETALFLHRTISKLPAAKQQIILDIYNKEAVYNDKKILLVDDDMRNIFALSKVLKERGIKIIKAENGVLALSMLSKNPDIDLVLMDIMMPEMDGYEAMQKIRQQEQFKNLPIIALTAKAMKEDRQKCIDAGANDYISKPVDLERLLSLMRVWLGK